MKLRYRLCRMGVNPGECEIDEAPALMELWNEERSTMICPFMVQGG